MMDAISVILAGRSEENLHSLSERVNKEEDLRVAALTCDGFELARLVKELGPDVLITDLFLKGLDGIAALHQLKEQDCLPPTLVVSSFLNDYILSELNALDIDYCFIKPYCMEELFTRVRHIYAGRQAPATDRLEELISEALVNCGILPHLRGFRYLREAVKLSVFDPDMRFGVTKILYPELARTFNTNPKSIERSIRNALDTAWRKCSLLRRTEYFGDRAFLMIERPTNSAFIDFIADFVTVKLDERRKEAANML